MTKSLQRPPVSLRRSAVQRHIETNRAAISAAWTDMEFAAARTEVNVRRAAIWAKRASGVAAMYATWKALRHIPSAGMAGKAVQLIVASKGIGRVLRAMSSRGGRAV